MEAVEPDQRSRKRQTPQVCVLRQPLSAALSGLGRVHPWGRGRERAEGMVQLQFGSQHSGGGAGEWLPDGDSAA